MTYLYAVLETTTEEVTGATDVGSTEIGTTESVTTELYTTEGMIHLRQVGRFIVYIYTIKYIFLCRQCDFFGFGNI